MNNERKKERKTEKREERKKPAGIQSPFQHFRENLRVKAKDAGLLQF